MGSQQQVINHFNQCCSFSVLAPTPSWLLTGVHNYSFLPILFYMLPFLLFFYCFLLFIVVRGRKAFFHPKTAVRGYPPRICLKSAKCYDLDFDLISMQHQINLAIPRSTYIHSPHQKCREGGRAVIYIIYIMKHVKFFFPTPMIPGDLSTLLTPHLAVCRCIGFVKQMCAFLSVSWFSVTSLFI